MNKLPTPKELEILCVLADSSNGLYGLEIVRESEGAVKRGSVYVLLSFLEKKGFVESTPVDDPHQGGTPRRTFKMTMKGIRMFEFYSLRSLDDD